MKVDILRGKMVEKRMTYKDCSRYLNITTTTFSKKMNGQSKFTNVVIKSRYTLLDLKCNSLEKQLKRFMKKIVKIVLDEINDVNNTNFTFKDVYFVFDREIITNALDNAQIEQYKANTKQIEINTLVFKN